jgi:hypothetical protein
MPNSITLRTSELAVTIGANQAGGPDFPAHKAGYNGVWSLTSVHEPRNCFVPAFAGLNLEHFMDDVFMSEDDEWIFEPRKIPMQLEELSSSSVRLVHAPSPATGVETQTVFDVSEPDRINLSFRAVLHRPPRAGRRFGFFWASYIHAPDFPSLFFRNSDGIWNCLAPDHHGHPGGNTVCHRSVEKADWGDATRTYREKSLAHSFSCRRFEESLMFGRPADGRMLYLQMFDQAEATRLSMSPLGGGTDKSRRVYSPAWDFQYILENPVPGREYLFRSRVIYKPYTGREEIDDLYSEWLRATG